MAENNKYAAAIKEMEKYFQTLLKEQNEQDTIDFAQYELAYSRCIPLLAETYFTGQTDDEKLEEYLSQIENQAIKANVRGKLKELKKKQDQVAESIAHHGKHKQTEKEKKDDHKKEKGKIFDRLEQGAQKVQDAPRKKVKIEKNNNEKDEKKAQQENRQEQQGEDIELQKKGLKKQLQKLGKQKCKFFPFCKNEETCQYFHPTQKLSQCTYFPNCRHGDNCLYIHEACRFKENCTKPGCPYSHPFKKGNSIFEEMMKSYLQGQNSSYKNKKKAPSKPHGAPQGQPTPPQ